MRKTHTWIGVLAVLLVAAGMFAAFTDLATSQYDGKINIRKSHTVIDSNFALLEGGITTNQTFLSATAVTNTLYITNGVIKAIN
tara:strand:- start:169 stop:420 length:252 start_codon:yes stop_codon:yes gene_type:complete